MTVGEIVEAVAAGLIVGAAALLALIVTLRWPLTVLVAVWLVVHGGGS
ncbi:MAG: hypothetical protein AB7P49_10570 [Bdellovibrionales bacterium]